MSLHWSACYARAAHGDALHHGAVTRHALLLLLAGTLQPPHRDLGVDEHARHGAVLLHGERVNAARACALGLRDVDRPAVLIVIDPVAAGQGGADKERKLITSLSDVDAVRYRMWV